MREELNHKERKEHKWTWTARCPTCRRQRVCRISGILFRGLLLTCPHCHRPFVLKGARANFEPPL
jgi:hypothetical protein